MNRKTKKVGKEIKLSERKMRTAWQEKKEGYEAVRKEDVNCKASKGGNKMYLS